MQKTFLNVDWRSLVSQPSFGLKLLRCCWKIVLDKIVMNVEFQSEDQS